MNRIRSLLAPIALVAAATLISAGSQAQTPGNLGFNIEGTGGTASSPITSASVADGASVNIDGVLTSAIESGGATAAASGVQVDVIYDPTVLTPVTGTHFGITIPSTNPFPFDITAAGANTAPETFDYNNTTYSSIEYTAAVLPATTVYTSPLIYATYDFQVNAGVAPGTTTEVYYSSDPTYGIPCLATQPATTGCVSDPSAGGVALLVNEISFNPVVSGVTFNGGYATLTVTGAPTPAPPAALLFAVGTLPAIRRIRQRGRP